MSRPIKGDTRVIHVKQKKANGVCRCSLSLSLFCLLGLSGTNFHSAQ